MERPIEWDELTDPRRRNSVRSRFNFDATVDLNDAFRRIGSNGMVRWVFEAAMAFPRQSSQRPAAWSYGGIRVSPARKSGFSRYTFCVLRESSQGNCR